MGTTRSIYDSIHKVDITKNDGKCKERSRPAVFSLNEVRSQPVYSNRKIGGNSTRVMLYGCGHVDFQRLDLILRNYLHLMLYVKRGVSGKYYCSVTAVLQWVKIIQSRWWCFNLQIRTQKNSHYQILTRMAIESASVCLSHGLRAWLGDGKLAHLG